MWNINAAQAGPYLIYSEANFEGQHVAPMGVKFGMDEGTKGPLLRAKFHPNRCNG